MHNELRLEEFLRGGALSKFLAWPAPLSSTFFFFLSSSSLSLSEEEDDELECDPRLEGSSLTTGVTKATDFTDFGVLCCACLAVIPKIRRTSAI